MALARPEPSEPDPSARADLAALARRAGLRRVRVVAWRDLDDPEAGGSELHAHRILAQWAAAGLDVELRTSAVPNQREETERDGYRVVRRGGRYAVFAQAAAEYRGGGRAPGEALVEIWNGMPFFSPLWWRGPRLVFLHHVHAEMWRMALGRTLGAVGETLERRVAPLCYRRSRIVTLSSSSRDEIVELLRIPAERVTVVPPGVEPRFSPAGLRSPVPLVVAVGRLVPVKRFDLLMTALAEAKASCPALRAVIVGEGYERGRLEVLRRRLGAESWLELPGRVDDDELVAHYRRAWVVASASLREGWGMTLTEAAACATPAVATAIAGHTDAVGHGEGGLLVDDPAELGPALVRVLTDAELRHRLGQGALAHAAGFTWEHTARAALAALAEAAGRPRRG